MRIGQSWRSVFVWMALLSLSACDGNDQRSFATAPGIMGPTSPLPAGVAGMTATAITFGASGSSPITWSVTSGSLPPGMTLDANTGAYSGTPTSAGSFSFTVTATNTAGSDSDPYTQVITAPAFDATALLAGNGIAAFATSFPAGMEASVPLTGVASGDTIVGIDRRPQNGQLYGLGYNASAGTAQLYAISSATGVSTPIGSGNAFVAADGSPVRIGVDATTVFGFDFNPSVDRIRVVNSAGQNFRMNPNNGAFVDGDAMAAGVNMDGAINGPTTTAQETAYTNNRINTTVTTQYTLNSQTDALCIQNPPNAGTQTACQTLSAQIDGVRGFDIAPGIDVAMANMAAVGMGLAVVRLSGQNADTLAQVNLSTGALTNIGTIGGNVIGIAIQQPASVPMIALSADATQLLRFTSAAPGTAMTVAITGVAAGETLVGLDYRPQTGQLYSLGVADAADTATLYVLDPQTGAASPLAPAAQIAFVDANGAAVNFPGPSVTAPAGYGFDFNPTVDRIRVVTDTGVNFRVNPHNGAPVDGNLNLATPPAGINTDGPINALPSGSTGVSAAAYTNSFGQSLTGGVTTQYVIDAQSNQFFIQNPPNAGTLTMPLAITVAGAALDFTAGSFDIPSEVRVTTSATPATGSAFAVLTVGGTSRLYRIDLTSGQATDLGALAANVNGLSVGQVGVK